MGELDWQVDDCEVWYSADGGWVRSEAHFGDLLGFYSSVMKRAISR